MYKTILIAVVLSLVLFSTVSAKDMSKSGGYTLCKNQLKEAHPGLSIDTKIVRIKYRSLKKTRAGVTHQILMRVAGIKESAYKVNCVVTRDNDNYVAVISELE